MDKIVFQSIGEYDLEYNDPKEKCIVRIIIKKDFKKALMKLDLYSHCLVLTKNNDGLLCYATRIIEVCEKSGMLIIEGREIEGELLDIKPYFPCEERVIGASQGKGFAKMSFKKNPIGEYLFINHRGVIQFRETDDLDKDEIEESLKGINEGDYVRILWWFHRFDKKEFRKKCTCNPPYENAPECGVFATRSPVRPNLIASTVVKVGAVDRYNHLLDISGFDGFEHSKILQIMPYEDVDVFNDVKVPKWVEHWTGYKVFQEVDDSGKVMGLPNEDNTDENVENGGNDVYDGNPRNHGNVVYVAELELENDFDYENVHTNEIIVENASTHNLKDVSVRIPKDKITVITGVSGSGKSSLAFDTIYYESQKQFIDLVDSNTAIATDLNDSKVGRIRGLQPSIAIEQRNLGMNPRSTVGSVTKVSDFLRLLFATIGERICPNCNKTIPFNNVCNECGTIYFEPTPAMFSHNHPEYMCPVCKGLGEELQIDVDLIVDNKDISILDGASLWWGNLRKHREKPNANWMRGEVLALAEDLKEDLELPFKDLSDEFKKQLFYGSNGREVSLSYENPNGRKGTITRPVEGVVNTLYRLLSDSSAERSITHLERFIVNRKCSRCGGERLREEGRFVRIGSTRYPETTTMNITSLREWCHMTYSNLSEIQKEKTKAVFIKILYRLKRLEQVGLSYLSLNRSIPSLSGGEGQRLKIATQFGSGLSNVLYIMDEPSKGLHPKDYLFLIETIKDLKKQNNTVIIVEHKEDFINMADYIVEIGPGAGQYGGRLVRAEEGNPDVVPKGEINFLVKDKVAPDENVLILKGASTNNLKNIDITIPLSKLVCVIGVSGSGKSSLISKTLYPAVLKEMGKRPEAMGDYAEIIGADNLCDVYYVSQQAIGKTSRSNPGTYTGAFDLIRNFYANLEEAKKRKLTREHFSFNSVKGQCEECKGTGEIQIPMHFMEDIHVSCTKCKGKRYQKRVLEVNYKGYTISDLLELEIAEVKEILKEEAKISEILDMLVKVGVGYIKLGQSAATLSGGEAQRIKLAKELSNGKVKNVLYILDEPTTGLHDEDVKKLIYVLKELTNNGATVIVIEHNPSLIQRADWIIEMGPQGGEAGGDVISEGWQIFCEAYE